jgi:hypothetical protein
MKTKPRFKIGDPVFLWPRPNKKEYGIVVGMRWDRKQWWWDYRVLFFGHKWPRYNDLLRIVPDVYVLRYLETSLHPFTPKVR